MRHDANVRWLILESSKEMHEETFMLSLRTKAYIKKLTIEYQVPLHMFVNRLHFAKKNHLKRLISEIITEITKFVNESFISSTIEFRNIAFLLYLRHIIRRLFDFYKIYYKYMKITSKISPWKKLQCVFFLFSI